MSCEECGINPYFTLYTLDGGETWMTMSELMNHSECSEATEVGFMTIADNHEVIASSV